jgi:hypothetical protein
MSNPILNYESPAPYQPTKLRTATWIMLQVFGGFYCLAGACISIGIIFDFTHVRVIDLPTFESWLFIIDAMLIIAGALGTGITYLWTSFGVRRRSRRAARIALTISFVSIVFVVILFTLNIMENIHRGFTDLLHIMLPLALYFLIGLPIAILAFCLFLVLREHRFEAAS